MLPGVHRLRRSADISRVSRTGIRAGRECLVVHVLIDGPRREDDDVPRVGLVVGRAIGTSVVRHRVARRLREISRRLVVDLPERCDVLIRALPRAADADSATLERDVRGALTTALGKIQGGVTL